MKKITLITAAIIIATNLAFSQGTAINNNGSAADNSALLDLSSTTKGTLITRMTTAERNAIQSPADGLLIFNIDCGNINYFFNGTWYPLNNGVASIPAAAGAITGSSAVCQGVSNVSFSVGAISGATNYLWYYSGIGASISGTTENITVDFSPSATSGILTVYGSNACGKGVVSPNYDITVTLSAAASVSISPNPSASVCPGTNVSFTATPVNGGASPSYQWKVNGTNVGTNSSVYSYTPTNGDSVRCIMTSNASCITGSPASSNTVTITVFTTPSITGTTPGSRTGTGSVTLGAAASSGTINWYSAPTGGSSLGTGSPFNTPSICVSTTFYVDATENGCTSSPRVAVVATVNNAFQVDNSCSLTANLVSYWKMDGNSNDFYGSNNGTNTSITYNTGKSGQAAGFNGSTSYINLGSPSNLQISSSFSISAWVKASASQLSYPQIVSYGGSTGDTGWNLYLQNGSGQGVAAFAALDDNGCWGCTYAVSSTNIKDNTWHLWVGIYTGTNIYIYVDGVLKGSDSANSPINYGASPVAMIGWKNDSGSNDLFNGLIDEVGIWSKVLSSQEISDLYNGGAGQTIQ